LNRLSRKRCKIWCKLL